MNNRCDDSLNTFHLNKEIIEKFLESQVEFVVIGGLAIAWHCPERQADDMDLLINPTEENSKRVYIALQKLGASLGDESGFSKNDIQAPIKFNGYYADLLTPKSGGPTYAQIHDDAVQAKVLGLPVLVASAASLMLLKKLVVQSINNGKEKHTKDIELLKKAIAIVKYATIGKS